MWKAICVLALLAVVPASATAQDYTVVAVCHTDNKVAEVDPVTGKILREFIVPGQWTGETHEGVITRDGKTMFVSIPYGKQVVVLDLETFKQKGTIESEYFSRPPHLRTFARIGERESTTADPHGVALSNDESKLYITVEFGEVPGVVVYDLKTKKSKKIDTVVAGNWLGVHPRTGKLYVPNRDGANNVTVINTKTDRILRVVRLKAGSRPAGVAFGGPNDEVWVSGDGDGSVTVMDSASDKVIKVIQPRIKAFGRIAVSPDGRFAAAAQGKEVSIIDTRTKEIVASLPISPEGADSGHGYPVFSPDSNTLHVMNESSNDMVTFDMRNMKAPGKRSAPIGGASFGGGIRQLTR